MKRGLFFVSPHNWYDHVSKNKTNRPLQLAQQFSQDCWFDKIIVINRINPKRLLKKDKNRQIVNRGFGYKLLQCNKNENTLYLEHTYPFGILERLILPITVHKLSKKFNFDFSALLVADPKSASLLRTEKFVTLFDAYDNWLLSPLYINKPKHLKAIELGYKYAGKYSNAIITNSEYMKEEFRKYSNRVFIVNNTSSLELNNINSVSKLSEKTVIGYIGNLHERININLVDMLLGQFKDLHFVFIGPDEFKDNTFQDLIKNNKNLQHIERLPYEYVPDYISKFDICIVPHHVDAYTLSQDSMKIYDYLSIGKPVVTTPIPPAINLSNYLYIANDENDFVEQIKVALFEETNEKVQSRIEYIKRNSWASKTQQIYRILKEVSV